MSNPTAAINVEEGGDDVKSARPLHPGRHTRYNGRDNGHAKPQGGANPTKGVLSSDRGLQPDPVKLESLVMVDQHAAVNTFSGLVHTACHTPKVGNR